jgi:Domain of unknown function (DUF4145)
MAVLPDINQEAREQIEDKLENGRLRCATCGNLATPEKVYGAKAAQTSGVRQGRVFPTFDGPGYTLTIAVCAACGEHNVFLRRWESEREGEGDREEKTIWLNRVHPVGRAIKAFPNTPEKHLEPYRAACSTLEVSPEASACMSRRCLQGILREMGYQQKDLVQQIDALLAEADPKKQLPSGLNETIDVVRNYGNFGAHPMNDRTTLQIIPVEPGEADWCIHIAEQLIDHFFEAPKLREKKIAEVNAKLTAVGKPPAKR